MEIKTTTTNSLHKTLASFNVGESANFTYNDFKISYAQSYRARIFRDRKLGLLPADMKFGVHDVIINGNNAVHIVRIK